MDKYKISRIKTKKFTSLILHWSLKFGRQFPWRQDVDPFRILVTEKLLQQTDASHVLKVYQKFFANFPTIFDLNKSTQRRIEKIIKPLGFWRFRARDLKIMSSQLVDKYSGEVPVDIEDLQSLYGVGKYIASATRCFCFEKHEAIIDVNVRRCCNRIFFWQSGLPKDSELETILESIIPENKEKEFNWALLDFSAKLCRKKPQCADCFANVLCEYYQDRVMNSG